MSRDSIRPRNRLLLTLLVSAAWASTAQAQYTCDRWGCGGLLPDPLTPCNATPVTPAPSSLWGALTPVTDANGAPRSIPLCQGYTSFSPANCRDSSYFAEFGGVSYPSRAWFTGVDIENGFALASLTHGLEVWDLRTSPEDPPLLGLVRQNGFGAWTSGEEKWPIRAVDAPAGVDTVAVLGGGAGWGAAILDLSNKSAPLVKYQFTDFTSEEVYAATIGVRQYAFVAATAGNGNTGGEPGLYVYDMTSALALPSYCREDLSALGCGGVFKGRIDPGVTKFVAGLDNYVVVSHGATPGVQIYDVSNVASCGGGSCPTVQRKLSALADKNVEGVALWKQGSTYYLGARMGYVGPGGWTQELRIYDVSCIAGSCGSLPAPLATRTDNGLPSVFLFLTFSRSGTTPFLYLGSDNRCGPAPFVNEWLYDVTNPSNPMEITPTATLQASAIYQGVTQTYDVGYWGWYLRPNPTGFNFVGPRRAKFLNNIFYRAAFSLFDFHRWGSAGPVAPTITSITATPDPALQCGLVTFTANGVSGSPMPSLSWQVFNASNQVVTTASGVNPLAWQTGPNDTPGTYTCRATATNTAGSDTKSTTVSVNSPPTLAFAGAPTAGPPTGTVVQFHVQSQGATEWAWDFGDDTALSWTSDPDTGPNPVHTYPGIGTYNVTAHIRNCGAGPLSSSTIPVQITSNCTGFGITSFLATTGTNLSCTEGLGCFVDGGPITFDEQYACGPTYFDYDWNGDGVFEDWGNTGPLLTRSFFVPGNFQSKMRIRTSDQFAAVTHGFPNGVLVIRVVEGANPTTTLPPTAPAALTATTLSESSIRLGWSDNSTFENLFHVSMSTNGGAFSEVQILRPNTTTVTLVGLTAATPYGFKVRASNDAGSSANSNVASATTLSALPSAPSSLAAATVSASSIHLTWVDNATNETSYRVEARTGASAFAEVANLAANTTATDISALDPETLYDFRVRAGNGQGFSAYTSVASATTLPLPPNAPADLAATAVNSGWVHLAWSDLSINETEFRVERKLGTGAFSEILVLPPDATTADIQGLVPSSPYAFRIRSANSGGFSGYSREAAVTTPADSTIFGSPLEQTVGFGLPGGWSGVFPGPPS